MRYSNAVLSAVAANLAAATPFSFPLANGFPNLNATELAAVETRAGGTLPNMALPSTLKAGGVQTLQLITANELFETAFFTELLSNITTNVTGYVATPLLTTIITSIIAQEELHALAANAALSSANATTIEPCQYDFPVSSLDEAIAMADLFTSVVLGVLPIAQSQFSTDGGEEANLVPLIGSIIGQEGEQNGAYRYLQNKVPSASPFLTGGGPKFTYTILSQFFVPNSCPNINVIGINAFPSLTLENTAQAKNTTNTYSVEGHISASNTSIVYISGQNYPVTVSIRNVTYKAGNSYFSAEFPFDAGFSRGLNLAALVSGSSPQFNSTAEVSAATLYGPSAVIIE
ncbi:hypothetical protein B7494_g2645 [Chlorociboria aeruginascens]|nr:hypothetical protein B7494_g2645 [Chlorociboria aeruginascens]